MLIGQRKVQAGNRLITAIFGKRSARTGNKGPYHNEKTTEMVLGPERVDVQIGIQSGGERRTQHIMTD